ncbi:MAG TPA: class II aldolase/adducin family protein [Solirubrobacteraceae bacterium]|nr:class II aldolase/adducin family protein [Solirubrobacteraceae bacterium]
MLEREREQVVAAARRLAALGLTVGTAGNVSMRAGERLLVTPTGAVLERVRADEISVLELDGTPVDGPPPTSELALHVSAHRRFAPGAVVHAHAPVATALACALDQLPAVHYQMVELGGPVRVARYETFGTQELADVTVEAMQGRTAVLMANHGTLTVGDDLDQAVERTVLLEWAATVYWRAAAVGAPHALDERQLDAVRAQIDARGYGSLLAGGTR